jgi:hypothetical protein
MLAAVVISAHIQLPLFALCPRCKESKPLKAFPRNRRRPTGHHSACRICHSKTETKRYHANKPRISAARRHRRHGVSPETFDFLMRTQDERCANCGTSFSAHPNSPCVDHDAETGKVRGLLCNRCNLRIGMAHHSIDVLTHDIIYLLRHAPPDMVRKHLHTLTTPFAFVPQT